MPGGAALHVARLREKAEQARAIAHTRKEGGAKQLLMTLAENFERLAELARKSAGLSFNRTAHTRASNGR